MTISFESRMLRLVLQSTSLLTLCGLSLTRSMGGTSSLDLMTIPLGSGVPGDGAAVGKPQEGHTFCVVCSLLYRSAVHCMDRVTIQPKCRTHLHMFPSHPTRRITECLPIFVPDPKNGLFYWVPSDCRADLSSRALLKIPQTPYFLLILRTLLLESLGPKFSTVHSPIREY